jgi:hypothetical protein
MSFYDELQTYLDQPWIFSDINISYNEHNCFTAVAAVTAALAELPAVGAGARDLSITPSRAPGAGTRFKLVVHRAERDKI